MTVWSHLPTIFKQRFALRLAGLLTLCVAFITTLLLAASASAAPGVNQTLSFQGRLLNSSGGIVPDGNYNMQFKLYEGGTATGGGSLKWTESHINNASHGITVKNGYFSVTLGSVTPFGNDVDWNQDTLYLSMNIGSTAAGCTPFTACSPDGEMMPMKRLTAVPYAMQAQNATTLGGMEASDLIHNQNSAQQTTSNFWISGTGRADTALQAPAIDTATAGTLTIGAVNATDITLAEDVTVAAGKSLTLAGGNTASRPASPSEGTLYFDTETKQLLVYANGKWQSDRSTASKVVGTSASGGASSAVASLNADGADYVNTSTTSAQTTINSALSALSGTGGTVYLMEGTYIIDGSISIPNNVTLIGSGSGTVIKLKNSINADINAIVATDTSTGTGVTVTSLRLNGNKANNSSGLQNGIYFNGMGANDTGRQGANSNNLWVEQFRNSGLMLEDSHNSIVANNHINANSNGIYIEDGAYITITGNLSQDNTRGIYASPIKQSTISANTLESNSQYQLMADGTSSGNTITGNTFSSSDTGGLLLSTATDNTVSGNRFRNNGGAATNQAIILASTSTSNTITGNNITDSSATTNNYAIDIQDAGSTGNYLADNSLGGGSIRDLGTANTYANQVDETGKLINKSSGGTRVQTSTNNATAFQVQNAAGTSALTVNTSNNAVLVAGTLDTTTATTLNIGTTSATAIAIGTTSGNVLTTVNGRALVKSTAGNNSTTAFQVQNASSTALITADTTNMQVVIGSSGNTITLSSSGITFAGNARGTKQIRLAAEYQNTVLDNGATGNNSGTMLSSTDVTSRMNYYRWTATSGTAQTYDIVTQVPIPQDFSAWAASSPLSITSRTTSTSNGTITLEVRDSSGTIQCNFTSLTMGSINTWITNTPNCLSSGTYTPGDYLTIRMRMSSRSNANTDVGNIVLNYLSNK